MCRSHSWRFVYTWTTISTNECKKIDWGLYASRVACFMYAIRSPSVQLFSNRAHMHTHTQTSRIIYIWTIFIWHAVYAYFLMFKLYICPLICLRIFGCRLPNLLYCMNTRHHIGINETTLKKIGRRKHIMQTHYTILRHLYTDSISSIYSRGLLCSPPENRGRGW